MIDANKENRLMANWIKESLVQMVEKELREHILNELEPVIDEAVKKASEELAVGVERWYQAYDRSSVVKVILEDRRK